MRDMIDGQLAKIKTSRCCKHANSVWLQQTGDCDWPAIFSLCDGKLGLYEAAPPARPGE